MELILDQIIERISEGGCKRFKIIRLKTISGNVHAVITDLKRNNQMLVALSY